MWDFAFEGDPNIVEVYIRHLRRKLDEPFDRQLIETIRGAGYRLDPRGRLTACAGSRPSGCASRWRRCSWSASRSPPARSGWSGRTSGMRWPTNVETAARLRSRDIAATIADGDFPVGARRASG